ncbi:MAG: glucose-6-phosphate dehydrogenase [Acidimicrobiales bacterium]
MTTGELSPKELGLSPSDMDVAEPAGEGTRRPDPLAMVIFGASGDLTRRKILPALSRLAERGSLPEEFTVVGVARSPLSDEEFRQRALDADPTGTSSEWKRRVAHFSYIAGDDADPATFTRLAEKLCDVDASVGTAGNRLYYLATVPAQFAVVVRGLGRVGLNTAGKPGGFARLVIEKPFGADVDSARRLSADIHAHFDEAQIFRIDHYMGKETVQNILALRFANSVFEPIWNRRHVDHVQVMVAESLGVEGRGEFYEHAGALRDIVQNHLMQVLALTLMEPPGSAEGDVIRDEKVKLLGSVVVFDEKEAAAAVVRGQYGAGTIGGEPVPAYRAEPGVDAHSEVETYVAMRVDVDNWRWAGVPIFVRTGKRLPQRVTEVVMVFQRPPHLPFAGKLARDLRRDSLTLRIQPDEGISLMFGAKVPGPTFKVSSVSMDFSYSQSFPDQTVDAYDRLLLDAMVGDPMLFIRDDEVQRAWTIVRPIQESFADWHPPLARYAAGSWGPEGADRLIGTVNRHWRNSA